MQLACSAALFSVEFTITPLDVGVAPQEDADVYPSGDAYIIVFSVVDIESFDDAVEILYELRKQQILQKTPVILVANKHDVVKQRAVEKEGKPRQWS